MAVEDATWYTALEQAQAADEAMWLLGVNAKEAAKAWGSFLDILRGHSGPGPLCIDGHEYHRRQRRRTKRKGKR